MSPNSTTNQKPSRVRQLREARGITREQLAVRAGISSSTLYLAERAGLMTPATAGKVAAALGLSVEEVAP
jgi:transcriptional regulator with XRE-family HTH domain